MIDLAVAVEGASSTPTESTEPPGFELLQKSPAAQVNSQVDANGVTVKKLSTDAPEDSCGLEEKNVWSAGKSITPVINGELSYGTGNRDEILKGNSKLMEWY